MNKLWIFQRENINFLLVFFITARSTSDKANAAVTIKPPQMWLTQYKSNQVPAPTKLEQKTDSVTESNVYSVDVTCEAEYPITLKFPYPESAQAILIHGVASNHRISTWNNQTILPVSIKFKRVIEINIRRIGLLSLNITCMPVDQNIQVSEPSIHIYWKGTDSIENLGKTLHIPANPSNNSPLVLPCRPAIPNLKVVLEKEAPHKNTETQAWKLFNISSNHVSFDPKIGFTFPKDAADKNIFGLYRCSIVEAAQNTNQFQFVILNVTQSTSSSIERHHNFVPRSILAGNASAGMETYDGGNMWFFKCCSGIKDKPPHMHMVESPNPLVAQVVRDNILTDIATTFRPPLDERYRRDDCYKLYASKVVASIAVVCQGENIDFVEEYTNVFRPPATHLGTNNSDRILKDNMVFENAEKFARRQKPEIFANQFLRSADIKTAPVSQKIMLRVLRHIPADDVDKHSRNSNYFCDKQVVSTPKNLVRDRAELLEYDRDVYYEGEEMVFMCLGGKVLYANGGYLRLSWKNGTKTIIKPTPKDFSAMPCRLFESGIGGNVHLRENTLLGYADSSAVVKFGKTLATSEMASVECWMPEAEGTGWDKISKNLTILPSTAPKFVEIENEEFTFSKGEKWKFLICTVYQGLPLPIVTVIKDGLPMTMGITYDKKFRADLLDEDDIVLVYRHTINTKKALTIVMIFPEIKKNHQGVYQCSASNSNKMVTRTMKISVKDETGKTNNA